MNTNKQPEAQGTPSDAYLLHRMLTAAMFGWPSAEECNHAHALLTKLETELATERAARQNAETEGDKVRLDWQRNMLAKVFFEDGKWICCIRFVHGHECWSGESPGAAIDAAMTAKSK